MASAGAPAALHGYRLQAFYTLSRIFGPGVDVTQRFQPEGTEDLDILDVNGVAVEVVQVKAYDGLVLSNLEPEKENSFFHRALDVLDRPDPPAIKLVNFGAFGPELRQAWDGDERSQARVAAKLIEKGLPEDKVDRLFSHIQLVSLDEILMSEALLEQIEAFPAGLDHEHALDLFTAWYYRLAEQRQSVSYEEIVKQVNAVGRALVELYQYKEQWHTVILPLETVDVQERLFQLQQEFHAGIGARYEHIVAGVDFRREHKIAEVHAAFQNQNVVIVHAASGQGKSTLAYRYLHDMFPDQWRYEIARVQDVEHALRIATALSGFAKTAGIPIAVYIDVNPRDTAWIELVRQLARHPSLHVLVTIREEDYRRTGPMGADFRFAEVDLSFDRAEAELIYTRAHAMAEEWDFLSFDAAWDAFRGDGPLLEFVYLLTQTETLQQRLAGQVRRIEVEVRENRASPDELRLLSLVAVASAYGARLRTRDVIRALDLPAPNLTVSQFEREYLLRRTEGGMYLEGLHPIRSNILAGLLVQPDVGPWLHIVSQVLSLMPEEDLESFILHALVDDEHRADRGLLLDQLISLRPTTWSGVAGILRCLLWVGADEYVEANREILDAAHEEMGPGWMFVLDLDFLSPGEGPEVGKWWETLGQLIPPERQARIAAIRDGQTPKDTLFERAAGWLQQLTAPPTAPSTWEEWRDVAELGYWASRLEVREEISAWVDQDLLNAMIEEQPLLVVAQLSYSLHRFDPERHRRWLESHMGVVERRLADEKNILALEKMDGNLRIHFIPTGDVDGESSDLLHNETMANLELVRGLLPGYEKYGAQGYGFKLAGVELPQGDSTHKEGVPAGWLLPMWLTRLNGMVSGIARLRYRPENWSSYLGWVLDIRRTLVSSLQGLSRALGKYFRSDRALALQDNGVNWVAWQRCWRLLGEMRDLPRSAVDIWGFASETTGRPLSRLSVDQKTVPTAIALRQYHPFLEAQRKYFSSMRAFFEQAPAVWTTNQHTGKLRPNDPKRREALEIVEQHGIETDPRLPVFNLFDGKNHLPDYQREFRLMFAPHLGQDELARLEEWETEALRSIWLLWYFYAYEPWKGAANARRQALQWMRIAENGLRSRVEQAVSAIRTPNCGARVLDYDRQWDSSPTLWVRVDLSDPTELYSCVEAFASALRDAIGLEARLGREYYLIQDLCEYIVLIPVVQGRLLNDYVWRFFTPGTLQAEVLEKILWVSVVQKLPIVVREELQLTLWDLPQVAAANQLSTSVLVLRQLSSQIAEFQDVPDVTDAGSEKFQMYLTGEFSESMSEHLQVFLDNASILLQRYNSLLEDERERRKRLEDAFEGLSEVLYSVLPGEEDDGEYALNLAGLKAYYERLEAVYAAVEMIRLLWIADVLEQEAAESR